MKKSILIFLLIIICSIICFAQSDSNSAPVKWQQYKISDQKVQIKFPKFPVKLDFNNRCQEITGSHFYAFADEVVYELKIYEKSKDKIPEYCSERVDFSENSFTNFISALNVKYEVGIMQSVKIGKNKFLKFENSTDSHKTIKWLLNDYENLRWFEFTFYTYKEKLLDEKRFLKSLQFSANSKDIEINDGAETLLGDEILNDKVTNRNSSPKTDSNDEKVSTLNIIAKPKPKYTDEARVANIAGSVRMRVTFLSNGAIGSVSPVNDFDKGLTNQAIIAAKRMAFLPMKRNGKTINVTKTVVYTFSIF